jgi:serine/threonine-protein phosphatase 2A regulatory subunit B'
VAQYRQAVLPIVFGALEENANNHWNPAVHGLTCNVRKMFMVRGRGEGVGVG